MIRLRPLLVFLASIAFVFITEAAPYADDINKEDGRIVVAIDRSAGFTNPEHAKPMDHYRFTVAEDGNWELDPVKGETRTGKLGAEDLNQWRRAIEDGVDRVVSDPMLGARDEPFMQITVQTRYRKRKIRIRLSEKLAQAIEEHIAELAKPGE